MCSLQELASTWLQETIQECSGAHDAEEDALAAINLFCRHILPDESQLRGRELELHHLCCLLTDMAAVDGEMKDADHAPEQAAEETVNSS